MLASSRDSVKETEKVKGPALTEKKVEGGF